MERIISEICNSDLKKETFKDAQFIMIAEGGAMGEPGAVCIVTAGGNIFHCNYVYGDVNLSKLTDAIPVLKEWDAGMFGEYSSVPDGWHCEYLGAGNHLIIRNDVYNDFKRSIGEDKSPSDIYAMWMDVAWKIIEGRNVGNDSFEDKRVYITSELVHGDNIPDSLRVQEGFFSDGRSYLSEMWCYEQTTNVTYYFTVDDPLRGMLQNDDKILEEYLIDQKKIIAGEAHHMGVQILDTEEGKIYSATVCVGCDDDFFCEAYM